MDDPHAPLTWYRAGDDAPFADFYALDPSENPTVRPAPAAHTLPAPELVRISGEEGLVVIARRARPVSG